MDVTNRAAKSLLDQLMTIKNENEDVDTQSVDKLLQEFKVFTREKSLEGNLITSIEYLDTLVYFAECQFIEAQKCLSNIILNYPDSRDMIVEPYIHCILNRLVDQSSFHKSTDSFDQDFLSILYYDFRITFLLSALCVQLRQKMSKKLGLPIIKFLSLHIDSYSESSHEMIVECSKVIFNLTIENCDHEEYLQGLIKKLFAKLISIQSKAQYASKFDQLLTNLVNLMTNMPNEIVSSITIEESELILKQLDNQLKNKISKELLLPTLNCCNNLSKQNILVRNNWFEKILLSVEDFEKRPEEYDTLRGRLVRLMTSPDFHLKDISSELLFTLCEKDTEKFITYTGLGNGAAFLASRGLFKNKNDINDKTQHEGSIAKHSSYENIRNKIDPITGRIERGDVKNNALDNMSESEKEYHAEELAKAIVKLSKLGCVKPAQIDSSGQLREFEP